MTRKYTNRKYLDLIQKQIVVFDGAMGTNLQIQNLTAENFGGERTNGCNDFLVISYPQAVEKVHRSFLEVGVDVIETCTFRANRLTMTEYGLQDRILEINRAAASLARKVADEYSRNDRQRLVAGSIGPTGKLPSMNDPELSNITFDELADIFREQAVGLIQGDVDLLLIETSQDILEVKAAILGIQQAFEQTNTWLPIQAQVTLDTTGRMLLGTDISAVDTILEGFPIDVIGLNCSTGPDFMRDPIQLLTEQTGLPVSCIPNAGLPLNIDGQAVYPLKPEPFAEALTEFVTKFGVNVVGGCCGTTPQHLQMLVQSVKGIQPAARQVTGIPRLASSVQSSSMQQEPAPFLIGERLNSQGSRKFKQVLIAEDYDSMITIARDQIESGAHGLDLCVALTERADESTLMRNVIKTLGPVVKVPFIFDSTEPEVLETALKTAPGRSLINSTNLEAGRTKADKIFALAKKYNAAVIVLTIDEQGMAKTADRKLEIARRIYDIATKDHGLQAGDLVFDDLTFTLATGDPEFSQSAIETLEGIRQIKTNLPGVLTSLGVSNISFGLKPAARAVINSSMLYHAVQAGLDMAIVNPAQITPYTDIPEEERELANDLIFNRRPDALQRLIEHFEKTGDDLQKSHTQVSPMEGLSAAERIHWKILHRIKDDVEVELDELLTETGGKSKSDRAVEILNSILLPAMKDVGDKFGAGELILPFVLQSAEVMKKSVSYLEQFLERKEGAGKGTLVLATVYGDVHDIGKNLVKTILSNNGYTVHDLGKQVPAETIISKAVELKADAIGLSALLVSTSKQMPLIVNELQRRKLDFPVLIGGAAINQRFGRRILMTDTNELFEPGVFYCKDAFEGLATMDTLINPEEKPAFLERIREEARYELGLTRDVKEKASPASSSNVSPAKYIPRVDEYGPKLVKKMPLEAVYQCLSRNELFRLSWGAKNAHGDDWTKLQADYEARLQSMIKQAQVENWLQPQAMYGYWPCQAEGDSLVIYQPASVRNGNPMEITRFDFPRQIGSENLCLADYFARKDSGRMDVVAFQVVTVGQEATDRFDRLQQAANYSEAYFTHGLAVQMAEAAAEYLHRHIRRELGLDVDQGKRYSWGYPAIPELSDHAKVFSLLPVEQELGMSLTSAYQLVPEQSTAAIILHHPQAKYYNTGESRINQLMKE
ncbi:MAG: methionine synthase [Leptolinea sp.]|jgi:5-methyltetrahydrofolate--homocysteine methyltransferase|nr:methionine synthase [Leptolinea sp.]